MGETPDTGVTPDSDSSCSDSAAADTSAGGEASPPPHAASLTGGMVGSGRVAEELSLSGVTTVSGAPPCLPTHYERPVNGCCTTRASAKCHKVLMSLSGPLRKSYIALVPTGTH